MPERDVLRIETQRRAPRMLSLWQALQPLRGVITFMQTGAHPDDETSGMLAALGFRDGLRIAYACSTRGQGGQNDIGLEAGDDLGALRTREMERAADVLAMTLYWFPRGADDAITDFGFSKSGAGTLAKWGREATLRRFVEVLRQDRPHIICPTFLDVPGQHGHHRAMTGLAFDAVVAAADPAVFPELGLPAWQTAKLYLPAWSGAGQAYDDDAPPPAATVMVESGTCPVSGADYSQTGEWSRALHRTQAMGRWIDPGTPASWPLHLAWVSEGQAGSESAVSDGLPAGLADLGATTGPLADNLRAADAACAQAIAAFPDSSQVLLAAADALGQVQAAQRANPGVEVAHRLAQKSAQLGQVLYHASGTTLRASAARDAVRAGEACGIETHLHVADARAQANATLCACEGWRIDGQSVRVPEDAIENPFSAQYDPHARNRDPGVRLSLAVAGVQSVTGHDLENPLAILPRLSAQIVPDRALINLARGAEPVHIALREVTGGADMRFDLPPGWQQQTEEGALVLVPPAGLEPGLFSLPLMAGNDVVQTVTAMEYDHTGLVIRPAPAVLKLAVVDVAVPDVAVGYIGGGNDRAGDWLRALGMQVRDLDDAAIRAGDFTGLDTIVAGIFALRTRPALAGSIVRIHDWVRAGGNLVTLYHRPWDGWDPDVIPPARLEIGQPSLRWRVTDEAAHVSHLVPDHPLLNRPNAITQADWGGWHKERGLYFAKSWDPAYKALLSMADAGEEPLRGGLLSARIGAGRHSHTSLIVHHQMEQLVPGAFALMANLVAGAG